MVGNRTSEQRNLRSICVDLLTKALLNDGEELWLSGVGGCLPDANAVDTSVLTVLVLIDGNHLRSRGSVRECACYLL